MAAKERRFAIKGPYRVEEAVPKDFDRFDGDGAVISKAITAACFADRAGTWEVLEWNDVIVRVVSHDDRSISIEVLR